MKKRLLSLLLAVAMIVALLPTAAWADDGESPPSNKTLSITAEGKPDVTGITPTKNSSNHDVYVGDGWQYVYTSETLSDLYLGVDRDGNALNGSPVTFKFNNPTNSSCSVNIYNASLSDSTVNAGVWIYSPDTAVTNCVFNSQLHIMSGGSASAIVKNCIFTNPSYAISGSHTLGDWNIFAKDPGVSEKHTISVTNGGKITKLKVGSTKAAMNTDELYVVGTLDSDLELTLDDDIERTIASTTVNSSASFDLPKHIPLTIKEDGTPNTDGMTLIVHELYSSDNWSYYLAGHEPAHIVLENSFSGTVGPNPVQCNVWNAGIITGGVFKGAVSSYASRRGTIQGGIFLGSVAADQNIEGGVFVGTPMSGVHTVSSPAELGKITTITLGNDTVTLDVPVDSFYFGGTPTNLSVTLDDGTVYRNIDTSAGTVTLEPKPEEPDDPTTYYTVIVEGGEARNERGDILDSEVVVTAGEKITLKLLDETQGEMVFSYWDVNNSDTALADLLAKTGFDKTAHETTFTMPAHDLTLTAKYRMPDEDAPRDDSFLMTAAAVTGGAVLTGLVVWQGYNIFSQVYLNAHLPEGTAIPTNRQQLALLLWNAAGQPEASAASYVFPDVADPDVQAAARWATEQGLLKARKDGTFAPTDSVTTGQVYRAWQKVKTAG